MKQPGPPLRGHLAATQQAPPASPAAVTVFLSYSHQDYSFILRLQTDLRAQGIQIWIDHEDLKPGTPDWEEAVRRAIRKADAVVLVASPNSRQSPYVKDELRVADMYGRPVYPVWTAGEQWMEAIPLGLGGAQHIDARGTTYASGIQQLVEALHVLPARHSDRLAESNDEVELLFEPRNPYKGLRAFSAQDAQDFFGREKLIEELNQELRRLLVPEQSGNASNRLLAIIGPSGSGKSSVVMAGILPRLRTGIIPGSHKWIYLAPMIPARHPIEALALTLAPHFSARELNSILKDLEGEDARGLHQLAASLTLHSDAKVVLFVDQFEELFTQTASEKERQHFINLLLTAATEPHGPLIVLLALRADFYDRPAQYPELARLLQRHHQLVLPMDLKDLHRMIEGPATLHDVQLKFQGDLIGDMLFEVQGQVSILPLLQFTLDQLFQRRRGHLLTEQAYREMGGVKGALSRHAEETYQALPSKEHRQMARDMFLRLLVPDATGQDAMRRRATRSEFELADPMQTQHMQETLERFISARLLTSNWVGDVTTVEVSHEALIREWKRLAEWLGEAPNDSRLQLSLSDDVTAWEQHTKPKDRLYRGAQLKEAQAWARRNRPSALEVAFLRASATQRILRLVGIIVVVLLLVPSIGFVGWNVLHPPPSKTLVTTLQDSDTTAGSLRWCIDNAPSGSTIKFAQSIIGTIKLNGDLVFAGDKQLTIVGPGANQLAISNGNNNSQIHVSKGTILTISGLSFKNSETVNQAFLFNEGTLTISSSIISGNKTTSNIGEAFGGGIDNSGTLTVTNNTIIANNSVSGDDVNVGGGIYNSGKFTLVGSTISNNEASANACCRGFGAGGGIFNASTGTINVTSSVILGNKTINGTNKSYGGGIENAGGTLTVTNSTFSGNLTNGDPEAYGGGITNGGKLSVTHSTFLNNTVASSGRDDVAFGGGIANNYKGTLIVTASTFASNLASGVQDALGGGIYNEGKLTVTQSTFSHNSSISSNSNSGGGGIATIGPLTAINSTFFDNSAVGKQASYGGGIFYQGVKGFSDTIRFCTLYKNASRAGGGIFLTTKGNSQITLSSNIIAANSASAGPDIEGALISGGYNLIENATGATGLNATTDKQVTLLDLQIFTTLGNNGGLTQTLSLLHSSIAIDAVPLQACSITITDTSGQSMTINTDQRGQARPDGSENACDVGAYESSY
jgi:hypothetical protein